MFFGLSGFGLLEWRQKPGKGAIKAESVSVPRHRTLPNKYGWILLFKVMLLFCLFCVFLAPIFNLRHVRKKAFDKF